MFPPKVAGLLYIRVDFNKNLVIYDKKVLNSRLYFFIYNKKYKQKYLILIIPR